MPHELNLHFPDKSQVIVTLNGGVATRALPFSNPLTEKDHVDIRWYLETYGAHSLGDPDDSEARRIAQQLPVWGRALFNAVFTDPAALKRFFSFQGMEDESRLLTVSAEDSSILALPWELLHDPAPAGEFLFLENPRISIRRRVQGLDDGRAPFAVVKKERVHLLFVVSRPDDAGFLDPRADPLSVMDAIDEQAPGRVTCEFLRPPTLDALVNRLEDKSKPAVDILHFDGHGVFDREGGLVERAARRAGNRFAFDEVGVKDQNLRPDSASPPNTGYLLFETAEGKSDFVPAAKVGSNLHRHRVALVILSACQSAAVAEDDADEEETPAAPKGAMGSVAARLTATGISSVLAMTHSVLVHTTRVLFGEFYKELARSKGIGEALDNARRYLANHPRKYDVQRGPNRVPLVLYDWFLPALYQPGADGPLLSDSGAEAGHDGVPSFRTNLPVVSEAGFFGRRRDLWNIERWFADATRRITITGFGGQGKTALALEAGRWLPRAGMFEAAVFVDYARMQAVDAVAIAVSNIGSVLGESLIDAKAATEALKKTPTLVILDNLEALAPESLHALLEAAVSWSEARDSRVLCTTRRPTFDHSRYRVEGTVIHQRIVLDGLGNRRMPDDALEWFAALMKLPPTPAIASPKREALIELFERVKFHPLSIRVLTQQLKTRGAAEVSQRLEELLAIPSSDADGQPDEDTPASLQASLQLSLDQLDDEARALLPGLGVFQGGAFEDDLKVITGLDESSWPPLRQQLEGAALIETESIPNIAAPFLRFHPTLASMLWAQLSADDRIRFADAHRRRYYEVSRFLYYNDQRNPHEVRAIAWRELPNLLRALHNSFNAGDSDAVDFADNISLFLNTFGLRHEAESVMARAQAFSGETGSQSWFLAQTNHGQQLYKSGRLPEAVKLFQSIMEQLGEAPTFKLVVTLCQLGRCFEAGGLADQAESYQRKALAVSDRLPQNDDVKRQRALSLTDLADILTDQGKYAEAQKAYEEGLELKRESHDVLGEAVTLGQLGTLALLKRGEGWIIEAAQRYYAALTLFQQLHDPASEAVVYHQLGILFEQTAERDEAEKHYRNAARIHAELNDLTGASRTWNQLGNLNRSAGKVDVAVQWFRKAIDGARKSGDSVTLSRSLFNLASLLRTLPDRLTEAREVAEEASRIEKLLDADVAEIWKTYSILAGIADQEAALASDPVSSSELRQQARDYRRAAREANFDFAGTRHRLRKYGPLIGATVQAVREAEVRTSLEQRLPELEQRGWKNLVDAIRRILDGETDPDSLLDQLDSEDTMIVDAILRGLSDPASITDLLSPE